MRDGEGGNTFETKEKNTACKTKLKNVFIKLCQKIKKTEDSNYFVF
jgi:hypothetical protein